MLQCSPVIAQRERGGGELRKGEGGEGYGCELMVMVEIMMTMMVILMTVVMTGMVVMISDDDDRKKVYSR